MSKNVSIHCHNQKFDVEDISGYIYVYKTIISSDFLNKEVGGSRELIAVLTKEEASYVAAALRTVNGEATPLQPVEKVQTL